tara:strand:- start:629 stop:889 length:261 start_codon:yes stop_codon:yes gene_type:complete
MGKINTDEASFRKGYKKAGIKTLKRFFIDSGLDQQHDVEELAKSDMVGIIESYLGPAKGKSKGGTVKKMRMGGVMKNRGGMFKGTY